MTVLHGFQLQNEKQMPEVGGIVRHYIHVKSGAELLSVQCEDENKVFGASFRTPPEDASGIAHILEHSVLCGSRKYPVKAPFLEMLKSSLNSFLNAMTFADKTIYPVASTNLQDFYNLVDVYLDAVFHPRLTPDILKQEGWHYELEGPDKPLTYKGVVFNEMKGIYASPERCVSSRSKESLFPDTIYGADSGGDPSVIPTLTFDRFKAFHQRYYHPSNAKLFFYGDDDPGKRLELLNAVLEEFSSIKVDSTIPLQPRFEAPRKAEYPLPVSKAREGEKQARITINWMLGEISDIEESMGLAMLSSILLGSSAAPLRKALIDSRIGDGLSSRGLIGEMRQKQFSAGLKGIDAADVGKVETLIFETLKELAENGIDPDTIEAVLNSIEFDLRENDTGGYPQGLSTMLRAISVWNYDHDPFAALAWEKPLQSLKQRIAGGEKLFEEMIGKYLLNNTHRTTILFRPAPDLTEQENTEEQARLDHIKAAMNDEEIEAVIEQTRALKRKQETPDTPEALATLPRLTLGDIPPKGQTIPIETGTLSDASLITHALPTNGIVYLDIGLDLRQLPAQYLPLVRIFERALLETGAGDLDMVQLSQRIGRLTGGIHAASWNSAILGSDKSSLKLFLRASAMADKTADLCSILHDVLHSAHLDNRERIAQLIDETRAEKEAQLVPMGHLFAMGRLNGNLSEANWAGEQIGGTDALFEFRRLSEVMKETPDKIITMLEDIRKILLNRSAMIVNIAAEPAAMAGITKSVASLIETIPAGASAHPEWPRPELARFEGLTIPSKVNYVAKGENLARLGHAPAGTALVASHWLDGGLLWDKIRVQGGAYGAFSSLNMRSNNYTLVSYRDPNLLDTISAYNNAGAFLRNVAGNDGDRERAIIGTIGNIDNYMLPRAKSFTSMTRYLVGESDDYRQGIRDQVLGTNAADIRRFADALDAVAAHGRTVVLGGRDMIEAANEKLEDRFTITELL